MEASNGSTQSEASLFHDRVEAFKSGMHKFVDKISTKYNGEPSWLKKAIGKTTEAIKAHPVAAVGIAVGSGYLLVRWLRRE